MGGCRISAQRSVVVYDQRGQATASSRQMAVLPPTRALNLTLPAALNGTGVGSGTNTFRTYDESHNYVARTRYDYLGRPVSMDYPEDPDWVAMGGTGDAPSVSGSLHYNQLGLPTGVDLDVYQGVSALYSVPIVRSIAYDANRLPTRVDYGDPAVVNDLYTEMTYDQRLRPTRALAVRTPTAGAVSPDLNAVTTVHDFNYAWDAVSNLTSVSDARATAEWPAGYRPWSQVVQHDALYRVTRIDYAYAGGSGLTGEDDDATDWRQERTRTNADGSTHEARDPMHRRPAPMVSDNAATRVRWLEYDYDWLANQSTWNDDQGVFYERSAGRLASGSDDPNFSPFDPALRPSALYLSTNISNAPATYQPGVDRGGYVWLDYGQSGNVTRMTVRSQCVDVSASSLCADTAGSLSTRHNRLKARCSCAEEQHYRYDWDELNRLYEARRYDRHGGTGDWDLMVQQRYRYDAGNVRMVKETVNFGNDGASFAATALQPYPGDYERRGLELDTVANTYNASTTLGTETQYLVGGARLVWARNDPGSESLTRDQRLTLPLSDLVQSTAAVVDLQSGELLEHTTFYPNGARETHRTTDEVSMQLEPVGFTGKEADEEVGLVYFGERYLIPRLGRWASVDPLEIHAVGQGGEALNGYHYVSGNLLQARDPLGLNSGTTAASTGQGTTPDGAESTSGGENDLRPEQHAQRAAEFNAEHGSRLYVYEGEASPVLSGQALYSIRATSNDDGVYYEVTWYERRGSSGQIRPYDPCANDQCGSARAVDDLDMAVELVGTAGFALIRRMGAGAARAGGAIIVAGATAVAEGLPAAARATRAAVRGILSRQPPGSTSCLLHSAMNMGARGTVQGLARQLIHRGLRDPTLGSTMSRQVATILREAGVRGARFGFIRSQEQLLRQLRRGQVMLAVEGRSGLGHAVVASGRPVQVSINGARQAAVYVRDPHFGAYYETVESLWSRLEAMGGAAITSRVRAP